MAEDEGMYFKSLFAWALLQRGVIYVQTENLFKKVTTVIIIVDLFLVFCVLEW